jgi:heat shock protein HtpX
MKRQYDVGLGARMLATLLLLGLLYVVMGYAVAMLFGMFVAAPGIGHFVGIAVAVALLVGSQYYYGAAIALRTIGADVVDREEYPDLHDRVGYLAQQAGVPKPRVAVADNETPNAFAAVLAHELAHVLNRDFQLMTVVAALSLMAGWVVRWGFLFGDGGGGDAGQWQLLGGYLAALAVWIGAFLVGRLVSRYREFAADRGAAMITGEPLALASALETIDDTMAGVPEEDLREAERASALLVAEVRESRLSRLFRTHPAVEDRVEKLRSLAVELDA